jgi:hypothetical protein
MNYANSKINILVNNKTYSFFYSHKKDSTFQDLIEYFSYLCPSLNICQCYHFRAAQYDNQLENQYNKFENIFTFFLFLFINIKFHFLTLLIFSFDYIFKKS